MKVSYKWQNCSLLHTYSGHAEIKGIEREDSLAGIAAMANSRTMDFADILNAIKYTGWVNVSGCELGVYIFVTTNRTGSNTGLLCGANAIQRANGILLISTELELSVAIF